MIKNLMEFNGVIMSDDKDVTGDIIEEWFFDWLEEHDLTFFGITNIDVEE